MQKWRVSFIENGKESRYYGLGPITAELLVRTVIKNYGNSGVLICKMKER